MSAAAIAKALGGHRAGATWMARCPAHDDGTPSLAIREGRDGKILLKCHAGCTQWNVIGALKERGIWKPSADRTSDGNVAGTGCRPVEDRRERARFAIKIWKESTVATGSPVETYLRSRGLTVPASRMLRFHPALKHPAGGFWPAMVGLVTRGVDGAPIGIHRTFLANSGSGKASVVPQKMMLGPCGGGAVRLGEDNGGSLLVGEGIETCLAAMQATARPAWAALSTSGIRSLRLPQAITNVVLLADGDGPGEAAARHAAHRWSREGRAVRTARAPAGQDFNDILMAGVVNPAEFSSAQFAVLKAAEESQRDLLHVWSDNAGRPA